MFTAIYLIACPVLILYSLGYIFNPINRQLEHTGIIYLSSVPRGANIYLGRSRFSEKTPAAVRQLREGTYMVRLQLRGYKPWKSSINVEAGKAAVFENILLIPYFWRPEYFSREPFRQIVAQTQGEGFFLVSKGGALGEYFIFDLEKEILKNIILPGSPFYSFDIVDIYTKEGSSRFILYGGALFNRKYLLLDIRDTAAFVKDISKLFIKKPQYLDWEGKRGEYVFAFYPGRLDVLNIQSNSIYPNFLTDIKGYGLFGKWLYYINAEGTIQRVSLDSERQEEVSGAGNLEDKFRNAADFYNIKIINEDIVLFIGKRGGLLSNIPPYDIEETGLRGVLFDEGKDTLVYWTKHKIAFMSLSEEPEYGTRFKYKFDIETVYENGRNIEQCLRLTDAHIIFRDNNEIFMLEIQPQGPARIEPILKVKSESSVFYSEARGSLYYLDNKAGSLCKIEILPKGGQ